MTRTPIGTVLRHMSGPGPERGANVTDAELLQRFTTGENEAAFLVLARKSGTIRRQAVGRWLHGVARRVALTAKRGVDRRRAHERRKMRNSPSARDDRAGTDLADDLAVVDEEIRIRRVAPSWPDSARLRTPA
ncbi:MAG: hypothetical protein JWO38_7190 [Gemmataceae bacterium]|nr:hypothetical protein [Gemmataceae bacterium]